MILWKCRIARTYMMTRMPVLHDSASHACSPTQPVVSSERMVSIIDVERLLSAKPRRRGVMDEVRTKEGLMKISNIKI